MSILVVLLMGCVARVDSCELISKSNRRMSRLKAVLSDESLTVEGTDTPTH